MISYSGLLGGCVVVLRRCWQASLVSVVRRNEFAVRCCVVCSVFGAVVGVILCMHNTRRVSQIHSI